MPANSQYQERRTETRVPADGAMTLYLPGTSPIAGKLLDLAASGFRARHRCPGLLAGAVVDFELGSRHGRARVVWTRILGEAVESGFLIVAGDGG